jgi:hypothetical protein
MMRKNKEDPIEEYIEIYGEYVSMKELGLATLLSLTGAFALYIATPYIADLLGLQSILSALRVSLGTLGATLGFLATLKFTRVKRVIEETA